MSYQTLYTALEALEKDLHQHIHLENNILFPRAVEMEPIAEATSVNSKLWSRLDLDFLQIQSSTKYKTKDQV